MSSPSPAPPPPPRRSSTAHLNHRDDDDSGLTQSLSQLSITNQHDAKSTGLPKASAPLQPPSRSSSRSPAGRLPSRSPSHGRSSRAPSPTLLRKASTNSLRSANGGSTSQALSSRRGSSTQFASPSSKSPPVEEEKPPLTDISIASSQLKAELDIHHGPVETLHPKAVVILNDAVYGHRFSRPRTSRSALSTIVERPERIKAAVLGISAAYVRLGERHSGGSSALHPNRDVHGLPSVPFRIRKTTRRLPLVSQAVTNVHGAKWMEEFKLMCESAETKLAMGGKELQRPDMPRGPDHAAPEKLHEGDLYLCQESLDAVEGALGAVCEAVDTVFGPGPRRAFVGVRPPGHHCSASHPSGFCWINNVLVGIMHAALTQGLTHAAIIDFDLHHGDGSQDIVWKHNHRSLTATKNAPSWKKTSIGYFSIHDINSYPCEMGDEDKVKNASLCIDNAHGQNIFNVHLQSWKTEQDFWELYDSTYSKILEKTRKYLITQRDRLRALGLAPNAAIFFSSGFDASEWESAGMQRHQVNVPTEFYARLSKDVVKLAAEEGLCVDGRVVSVLEGGYSDRALCSGVLSHLSGLVSDHDRTVVKQEQGGLAHEMVHRLGVIPDETLAQTNGPPPSSSSNVGYDPKWWASTELDKLESANPKPHSPPRKPRKSGTPTYCSPTQASTAKVTDPIKMRRSLSGLSTNGAKAIVRPPSPPPPEVSWVTAAHELTKLLIPSDRQTDSCTAEDLNAEATRQRRERQAAVLGLPLAPPAPPSPERSSSRMALRERRAKSGAATPTLEESPGKERKKPGSEWKENANPRAVSSDAKGGRGGRRTSRRLSGASAAAATPRSETPPLPPLPPLPAGINSVDRPTTSRARRPDTAMSARTQSADKLPVKKTRAPANQRQTATPKATPQGTPRAPRTAKRGATPAKKTVAANSAASRSNEALSRESTTSSQASDTGSNELDGITSGMKKIKINLITQAQKEAREKARLQGEKAASPSQHDRNNVFAQAQTSPQTMSDIGSGSTPVEPFPETTGDTSASATVSSGVVTPVQGVRSPEVATPLPGDSNRQSADSHNNAYPGGEEPTFFIPYQPEGPQPETMSQHEPLTWLPPNVPTPSAKTPAANTPAATPIPAKKQSSLFHYTSGIPFAPRPQQPTEQAEHASTPNPFDRKKADAEPSTPALNIPKTLQK